MVYADAAYITGFAHVLPGKPVLNDQIETFIGRIKGRASAIGRRALSWNGIRQRHYALGANGQATTSNAAMCAGAVSGALDSAGLDRRDLTFLAAATTQGDYLVPGHAANVHGELGGEPLEIASFQSVCGSSLMAAKAAWHAVRSGEHKAAVACAGEFSSRWFRPAFYEDTALIDDKGRLRLEADFLRFTLSDGAGAVVLEPQPKPRGLSLKVDYIDLVSLAGSFPPCMWAGGAPDGPREAGATWGVEGPAAAHKAGAIALLQDFTLLKSVIRAWLGVYLKKVDEGRIRPAGVDWLLCHYSAASLRREIVDFLHKTDGMIEEDRWFSNLATVGNIGSASIWVMLSEFMASDRPRPGQRILCIVPESGRAFVGFMMLEVVA